MSRRDLFLGSAAGLTTFTLPGVAHTVAPNEARVEASPRWRRRPEGSNWGEFGPDDQLGRLNLLTAPRRLKAIAEVTEGRSFSLSLPLDYPGGNVATPVRYPPRLFAASNGDTCVYNNRIKHPDGKPAGVVSDDAVLLYTQYSTQWDGFAHFGAEFDADDDGVAEVVYYNGWRAGDAVIGAQPDGSAPAWARCEGVHATALGIENMAVTGVQGRAVMVDLQARYGRTHHAVSYDDLMRIMERDRVQVEIGDILCLYTGYDEVVLEMKRQPTRTALHETCAALDGADTRLLKWITDSNVAAIASDNRAVEMLPLKDATRSAYAAPLHVHCLFKLGVPLGEMWYLSELARWLRQRKRSRFLLTAPPLRLPGAVGSPVTPVATV